MHGPRTAASVALRKMKYQLPQETFLQSIARVGGALADDPSHEAHLFDILAHNRFNGGGRIMSAMGSRRGVTAYNCFVSGTIGDDSRSILLRNDQGFMTMRQGGGIGFDFSPIRPRNEIIQSLGAPASGPVPFMGMYNGMGLCVSSAGHRRGAMMAMLRCDHPDIREFILAKNNTTELLGFNCSVAVTDELMEAVARGGTFDLRWGGRVYETVDARELWELIMQSTWDWGEPGVVFIDTINRMNNLSYCETIAATNPCGEQPLPPFGACLLGSFNLTRYLSQQPKDASERYSFDWDQLEADIPHVVRAMDNVVDRSGYPLPEQEAEAKAKRRMGLGVFGAANAGEALGKPYGSRDFCDWLRNVQSFICQEAYYASAMLAKEKGSFPLYREDLYLNAPFIQRLPQHVRDAIQMYGIRNSHLTSTAPTGTISFCADNASSGIEPVFSIKLTRPVFTPTGREMFEVEDYGFKFLGVEPKVSADVTAEEHINVLAAAQQYTDSAVAKTINMDGRMPREEFRAVYRRAWEMEAKGCTTFNADGKKLALLKAKPAQREPEPAMGEGESCRLDLATGRRECA